MRKQEPAVADGSPDANAFVVGESLSDIVSRDRHDVSDISAR
jgi:hypothetical protein